MIHTVHLLLGAEFEQFGIDLRKYIVKYGEGNASSYFATLIWSLQKDNSILINNAELQQPNDVETFYSGLENLYQIRLKAERTVKNDEEIKLFFSELYNKTVTISNPGDSNSLHLCIYLPLYDKQLWSVAQRIVKLLNGGIQQQYTVDILGIAADMAFLFLPFEKADNLQTNLQIAKEVVEEIVVMKEQERNFAHFILIQNCNSQGIALNLNHDAFIRIVGELALLSIEHYTTLFPITADFSDRNIITFGLSVLNLSLIHI